jgi:hypothetical protein
MDEYISREMVMKTLQKANIGGYITERLLEIPTADAQPIYYAENVQNEVLNYLFNKEREAESMSYCDKRQERIATIREIIRFVEDIDPRMDGDAE